MTRIPDPEIVIALGERLRSARKLAAHLEREWVSLFNTAVEVAPLFDQDDDSAGQLGGKSLASRITDLLAGDPQRAFTADEVSIALTAKPTSVSSILSRLVKDGEIEKRSFSQYGAKQELSPAELGPIVQALSAALEQNGLNTAAVLLENAAWRKEGDKLVATVGLKKTMLDIVINEEALNISRAALRGVSRIESFEVEPTVIPVDKDTQRPADDVQTNS